MTEAELPPEIDAVMPPSTGELPEPEAVDVGGPDPIIPPRADYWVSDLSGRGTDVHCHWVAKGEPEHERSPDCPCKPTPYEMPPWESPASPGMQPGYTVYVHTPTASDVPPPPIEPAPAA